MLLSVTCMASTAVSPPPQRGAIYARYSTDFQNSIEDQIRECKAWAAANNVVIPDGMIFIDRGVTGKKSKRVGMQAMLDRLDEIDVVITLRTCRLFRNLYKTLEFIAENILDRGKRVAFVSQDLDTAKDDKWRYFLPILGMMDESRLLSGNASIQAAHKGMNAEGLAWGSRTFGYTSEEVEGRKTKKGKARRRWVKDETESGWVEKIFNWFVKDGLPITQIIERLNKEAAPLPPKCSSGRWQRGAVIRALSNTRYRGVWPYGEKMNVWQHKAEYNRQIERDEPLDIRIDEDLRIIDDATWFAAQKQLEVERERQSHRRRRGSGERKYTSVLNGLCFCAEHKDQVLTTCGAHGKYFQCRVCKDSGDAYLSRFVDRELATRLVAEAVGKVLASDESLTAKLKQVFVDQVAALQRNDPGDEKTLHQRLDQVNKQIDRAKKAPVVSDEDEQENRDWLRELRGDRAEIQSELSRLKTIQQCAVVPSDEQVEEAIGILAEVLAEAATVGDVEREERAHRIIKHVTGGRIEIHQEDAEGNAKPTLKAVFSAAPLRLLLKELNAPDAGVEIDEQQVTIELREPTEAEQLADEAKALEDEGLLMKQIVQRLTKKHGRPISRGTVVKALDHWYESRGQQRPDGRSRRSTLDQHTLVPTTSGDPEVIASVMKLFKAGKLYQQIANELKIDRNTVTKIVKNWHDKRGLPVPDGRTRRKSLDTKSDKPHDPES
jgi:DNA invertase Pin-like site-specific DNA recombinase